MSLTGITDKDQVDALIKNLAAQSSGRVQQNVQGTTDLIANNGNL